MKTTSSKPVDMTASTVVLLCFLPAAATPQTLQQRTSMTDLTYRLQQRLPKSVRVLKVDESLHPEVVKSFNLNQLPAFVLVDKGIERWRQEGVQVNEEPTILAEYFLT